LELDDLVPIEATGKGRRWGNQGGAKGHGVNSCRQPRPDVVDLETTGGDAKGQRLAKGLA
jgi:hypothetical protein